jgi:chemotaxis protein MotA
MQLLVDGADEAKLVGQMEAELEAMKVRHGDMQGCVKAWIDLAPAMGMIGTLVGLVIMLGNMSDPASIGPAMAVALLTTMYGAIIANVLFMPMLTKLENYTAYEVVYRQTVILGLRGIARGESPRNMQDQMVSLLAPKAQEKFEAAA